MRPTVAVFFVAAALCSLANGKQVVLSNLHLPEDTSGNDLITGEADVLQHNGSYYFYFNNWGGCPGVNCCNTSGGCASCCFQGPNDACVYTSNHSVVAYKTDDLQTWEFGGVALAPSDRKNGTVFRPHVVYNAKNNIFVMWYEDRWDGQKGYAVATSTNPLGPFKTVADSVPMATGDKIGDFDIFIDPDTSVAYHVRTGFAVEELNSDYTGPSGASTHFSTPEAAEGPVMFKKDGLYYILPGTSCCACKGGSSVYVFTSPTPLGNYTYQGEIGSNPSKFDPHSPNNFVTRAQASAVFEVNSSLVWMGNQWVTSQRPGNPRDNDLLYFTPLSFNGSGLQQLQWQDQFSFDI
ncbi:glycosyl family 43 [Diplonema papillatum]|nr:glycosyl family 43 [Diplonema papillatum]|eukprot:gene11197-17222_t